MTRITHRSAALVAAAAAMLPLGAGTAAATVTTDQVPTMSSHSTVDAVGYADQLVRAWGRGDRPATEVYATSSVAQALFGYSSPGGVSWRRTGWEGAAGTIYVTYHDDARGGGMTVGVSNVILGQGGRHAAYTVRFSRAHPIDAVEYADRLVRAWGRGDRAAASRYATPTVLDTLFGRSNPGGGHWRRTAAQGAAGTTFVTYHDDARGGHLVLGVGNAAEQDGRLHAVYRARFTR